MDIEKKKTIRIVLIIILILIILFLWLVFMKGKSFSSYKKEINSSGITEVAKPIFEVEGASNIKIYGIEDTVYTFNVKNYNSDNEISQVPLRYYIQIENTSQADLDFILTSDGKSISLNNNKTGLLSLSSSRKQNDEYQLRIVYNDDPAITTDIDGNVQIKVEAVQEQ